MAVIQTLFPLRYFKETTPPAINSAEWRKLNWSKFEFGVTNKDGLLLITRGPRGTRCELKIPGGKLVGLNNGELGGKLTFKPADANKPVIEIKKGNIKFIFVLADNIYFIEEMAHAAIHKGLMYKIDTTDNKFTYTKVLDFTDEPEAYALYQGNLLLASYQNFYRIGADLKKETLVQDAFWSGLFPTSIAVLDEWHVYIGLRSGYGKLDLSTKKTTFYRYTPGV
jgi:hypothetical protein